MSELSISIEETVDRNLVITTYILYKEGHTHATTLYQHHRPKNTIVDPTEGLQLPDNDLEKILKELLIHTKDDDHINTGIAQVPCTTRKELVQLAISLSRPSEYDGTKIVSTDSLLYANTN